jgi:cytochrome P450
VVERPPGLGPFDPAIRADPYPFYRWLRERQPVFHNPRKGIYALSRYADVLAAARNHELFSSAAGVGPNRIDGQTLISTDPPRHTRLRKAVHAAFTPGAVERLAPRIRAIIGELLDPLMHRGSFDLIADVAHPLPVIVIAEIIGIEPARRADFRRWSNAFVENAAGIAAPGAYAAAVREFGAYLVTVAAARRAEPREDLISHLLSDDGRLEPAELYYLIELLLAAGNETTTNLAGNAALALARFPDQWRQAAAHPALLPALIEEAARFDAPIQALFRTTTAAVELHGHVVPAGAKVALLWGAANRDPEVFSHPDTFDLARSPNPHLAFGSGIHYCIGAPLARLELRLLAEALLERFASLEIEPGHIPSYRPIAMIRGPLSVPLRFSRRAVMVR